MPELDVILRLEYERDVLVGSVLGCYSFFCVVFFFLSGFTYYLRETKKM